MPAPRDDDQGSNGQSTGAQATALRRFGPTVLVLLLGLAAWRIVHRGAPEYLGELPLQGASEVLGIRGDDVLIHAYRPGLSGTGDDVMLAWSIKTRRTREVATIQHGATHLSRCWLTRRGIYALSSVSTGAEPGARGPIPPAIGGASEGMGALSSSLAPPPGARPVDAAIDEVPEEGGTHRRVCSHLRCILEAAVTVTDSGVYWLQPVAPSSPGHSSGPRRPGEQAVDLVFQPLRGGAKRVLLRHAQVLPALRSAANSAVLELPGTGLLIASDWRGPLKLDGALWSAGPARVGSRWVWIAADAPTRSEAPSGRLSLRIANEDGSQQREISSQSTGGALMWVPATLATHGDAVFIVIVDARMSPSLWRLRPDRDHAFQRVADLARPWSGMDTTFIEGNHLYQVLQRQRETGAAWSAAAGSVEVYHELYRIRMPD